MKNIVIALIVSTLVAGAIIMKKANQVMDDIQERQSEMELYMEEL
jgi:outer membrane murein-binding lipoprotein Lpp